MRNLKANKEKEMKTSREQFDEWVKNNMHPSASNATLRITWGCWQASRQCIEVGSGDCVKIKLQNGGEASIRDVTKIEFVEYKGA